jgi:hypothetical protein
MRRLIGLLGLGVFSQAQSRRAAILLTGHVRTFDLTAPTLDDPHQFPADRPDEVFLVPPQPRVLDGPPHDRETLE